MSLLPNLGLLGTLKLLIRALGVYASHQAAIANELKILNRHIARIWPEVHERPAPAEEPLLSDDPYTIAMAEDAAVTLQHELGRAPSSEEVVERMRVWKERRDPVAGRPSGPGWPAGLVDGR